MARLATGDVKDAAKRYSAIRGMVAKQNYTAALDAGWQLYASLCSNDPAAGDLGARPVLGSPPKDSSRQRTALVVGAVLNLLMGAVEGQVPSAMAQTLLDLQQPLKALPAWLKCACLCTFCASNAVVACCCTENRTSCSDNGLQ